MSTSLAIVYSRGSHGINAPLVTVETHLSNGLPSLSIVGLPEAAVRESKDRVRSAILNTHFEFPRRRITINLAPADLPKEGSRFDLAIALGILMASGQIQTDVLHEYEFAGELALSGALRPIQGTLPFALATHQTQRKLILPQENAIEASLINNNIVLPAQHLLEVCAHLQNQKSISPFISSQNSSSNAPTLDLMDVRGQEQGKRALEIAAAGQHSLLLIGPPGTGKTMLASRLPGILPLMSEQDALDHAAILSISGKSLVIEQWRQRPFRAPHHSASAHALTGGGSPSKPGEISLAHGGVLFLDEFPEFKRSALEALREPLESGTITISRAAGQTQFPARFQLIAAMNPCPCGHFLEKNRCQCSVEQIKRYQNRVSGPLLDRLDMHIIMSAPSYDSLHANINEKPTEQSIDVRARVIKAHGKQMQRQNKINAHLSDKEINTYCVLEQAEKNLLEQIMQKFQLSARSYHRILRVARTIADLNDQPNIQTTHIAEAASYRVLDKMKASLN